MAIGVVKVGRSYREMREGLFENCANVVKTGRFSVSTKPERILALKSLELQGAETSRRPSSNQMINKYIELEGALFIFPS